MNKQIFKKWFYSQIQFYNTSTLTSDTSARLQTILSPFLFISQETKREFFGMNSRVVVETLAEIRSIPGPFCFYQLEILQRLFIIRKPSGLTRVRGMQMRVLPYTGSEISPATHPDFTLNLRRFIRPNRPSHNTSLRLPPPIPSYLITYFRFKFPFDTIRTAVSIWNKVFAKKMKSEKFARWKKVNWIIHWAK